jgi:mutator protein MutT
MKTAVGIALVKKNTVLFQLRDEKTNVMPRHWGLPSGEVKKGETLKRAIMRELKEETGYQLKNPIFFATDNYEDKDRKVKNHLFYEKYDSRQEIKCFEGEKMVFLSLKNLKRKKVIPRHKDYARKAMMMVNKKD